jgi:hypothetical protein
MFRGRKGEACRSRPRATNVSNSDQPVFRQGDCRFQLPTVRGALSEMDDAMQQIRDRNLLADLPFEAPLQVLDLVERYHATADALDECSRLLCTLEIQRYWGDYGL